MNRKEYRKAQVTREAAFRKLETNLRPVHFSYGNKLRFLEAIKSSPSFVAKHAVLVAASLTMQSIGASAARGASRMRARGRAGDSFYAMGSAELPVPYASQGERETSADRPDAGAAE